MNQYDCIKVESIRVKINGSLSIDLTPAEARKLYEALKDLVGPHPAEPVFTPSHPSTPLYPGPIWVEPNVEPWPNKWQIYASDPNIKSYCLAINAQ